ncbi:MAG: ABC transporter ATP-binding protein [Pirellulales bacterium]|nr:ABC transporter ATP-binding protein [Pirellulales bacterium]
MQKRPPTRPILEVRQAVREYVVGEVTVAALRGIDVKIHRGEFVAIMGPSGSGKSTLLNLLGAIDVPTTGEVFLEDANMAEMNDDERTLLRRRKIGFIFQRIHLLPTLTAVENVALPLQLDGVPRNQALTRAELALHSVNMDARGHHLPSAMSGGEQQRVAIARALVIEPAIVLADEPTGSLDSVNGQQIVELLRKLVDDGQQTIVMVTHDPQVAAQADRIIHVRDGHLAEASYELVAH